MNTPIKGNKKVIKTQLNDLEGLTPKYKIL